MLLREESRFGLTAHNLDRNVVGKLNRVIRVAVNYFGKPACSRLGQFDKLNQWIRGRIRAITTSPLPGKFQIKCRRNFSNREISICNHNDTSDFQKFGFFGSGYAGLGIPGFFSTGHRFCFKKYTVSNSVRKTQ
uniref:Uncharacterized protein n=1 Tax=Candidatus Kentrum sp. TC TaxID=2126339 RepID=A0A450Z9H4_9GAMM|nr:MAG: hypothetical protein BECKTC1821D_GA0114238_11046 [Candidatus Kentron sp. TC]